MEVKQNYHSVVVYKLPNFDAKMTMNFLDINEAKVAHRLTACELSKQLKEPFTYGDFIKIKNHVVRLIKNIPIVYYNVNDCGEIVKVSFDKNTILRSINEFNNLGEKCHLEQSPSKFENYGV